MKRSFESGLWHLSYNFFSFFLETIYPGISRMEKRLYTNLVYETCIIIYWWSVCSNIKVKANKIRQVFEMAYWLKSITSILVVCDSILLLYIFFKICYFVHMCHFVDVACITKFSLFTIGHMTYTNYTIMSKKLKD